MTFNEYQDQAMVTATQTAPLTRDYPLVMWTLGLCGEAGELAEKIKKLHRDGVVSDAGYDSILGECGDVLWYLTAIVTELGGDLEYVAVRNIKKLKSRAARGTLSGSGDDR